MNKLNKPIKRKLSAKLLIGVVIFALIIMIFTSAVVGYYYFSAELSESTENAFALARSGARMVDGDRVLDYTEVMSTNDNGDPIYYNDEYYAKVMGFLNAIQEENDLVVYYYVCVPKDDGLFYIWDATSAEQHSPQGYFDKCPAKEWEIVELAFSRTPKEKIVMDLDKEWGNLLTAYSPIYNTDGEPVALVGVDLSIEELFVKFNVYLILILASILIVTAIAVFFLFRLIRRLVIKPIEKLNNAVGSVVGELSGTARFDLEINSGDELEELADSFRKMDDDLHDYVEQLTSVTADRERIHAEMNVAKRIQSRILPNDFPAFPDRGEFDIHAIVDPCEQIGGDFYDYFLIDDDHLAMLAGDVAGYGVPAALYMVIAQTLIKSRAMQSFTPADVLQSVSEQMISYKTDLSSAVWFAVLELSTGNGVAINAGYGPPVLCRAGKRFELQEYETFPPVGASESVRYRDHGFRLEPGDSVFIFSDGVQNEQNDKGESFGSRRVLELLNREPEATPSVLIQTVKQAVDHFNDGKAQSDDLMLFSMKYYGPKKTTF